VLGSLVAAVLSSPYLLLNKALWKVHFLFLKLALQKAYLQFFSAAGNEIRVSTVGRATHFSIAPCNPFGILALPGFRTTRYIVHSVLKQCYLSFVHKVKDHRLRKEQVDSWAEFYHPRPKNPALVQIWMADWCVLIK
jgi:hypothetical protein